jgi:hypothetical protein
MMQYFYYFMFGTQITPQQKNLHKILRFVQVLVRARQRSHIDMMTSL